MKFHKDEAIARIKLPFSEFKKKQSPIMKPSGEGYDKSAAYNPAVIFDNDIFHMIYRAQDEWKGPSYLMYAVSKDGYEFEKEPEPVLFPSIKEEIPGGCEDPRIVKINGKYYLTYTAFDGKKARLCLAVSKNLKDWEKIGPIIENFKWSKAGAIIPQKIMDKYWMYFGDSNIWIASSEDLINWETNKRAVVLKPRKRSFDSALIEPGPPPLITYDGILLILNGADRNLNYHIEWAYFSKEDPAKMIARAVNPLLSPSFEWEKKGQVNNVCFAEGIADVGGKYYLYYGAADTYIGIAVAEKMVIKGHGE